MIDTRTPWLLSGLLLAAAAGPACVAAGPDDPPPLQGPVELLQDDDHPAAPPVQGPIHEAFASRDAAPAANPVRVEQAPPPPVVERPRGDRPGPEAQWIGGYWAWDAARRDYVWAAGGWRVPPAGKIWVNGQWRRDDRGWYRIAGTWSARQTDRLDWRQAGPPADHPADKVGVAPGPDFFFIPGQYVPDGDGLAWRAGFWSRAQRGWDWVPARWVRRADGWGYREGHWERATDDRGPAPDTGSPFRNRVLVSEPRDGPATADADGPAPSARTVARPPFRTPDAADLLPPRDAEADAAARATDPEPGAEPADDRPAPAPAPAPEPNDRPAPVPPTGILAVPAPPPGPGPDDPGPNRRPGRRANRRGPGFDPLAPSRAILRGLFGGRRRGGP